VGEPLSDDRFDALFDGFERAIFRFESRPRYAVSYEQEMYERFLAGGSLPPGPEIDWWRPWLDWVADHVAAGRSVRRVRLLDEPVTDYQRFSLWGGQWNAAAGEGIRYLARAASAGLGIPDDHDWWIFDDAAVATLAYDSDGAVVRQELVTSPDDVARYCHWRDLAFAHGLPTDSVAAA
jgi:hypothetical protein